MNNDNLIAQAEESYSNEWEQSSIAYEQKKYYDWCINQIQDSTSIIEIGTGIGICTEKLLKNGRKITSIEENVANYQKAKIRLENSGLIINSVDGQIEENNLIFANFITDNSLHPEILNHLEYDTIICWFMGVHSIAHYKLELIELGYNSREPLDYRDLIYDKLFSETSKKLPENGMISLIERTNILKSDEEMEENKTLFSNYYKLDNYGLAIEKIEQFPIENLNKLEGIEMKAYDSKGMIIDNSETQSYALTSTLIKKTVPNNVQN
jgi:hypothetical protein